MKKIIGSALAIIVLAGLYLVLSSRKSPDSVTSEEAVAAVKKAYPAFQEYPSDSLPPKRVEVIEVPEGWRVGMYDEGSGVSGILRAACFLVAPSGEVTETGFFSGEGPAKAINLATCVPTE